MATKTKKPLAALQRPNPLGDATQPAPGLPVMTGQEVTTLALMAREIVTRCDLKALKRVKVVVLVKQSDTLGPDVLVSVTGSGNARDGYRTMTDDYLPVYDPDADDD